MKGIARAREPLLPTEVPTALVTFGGSVIAFRDAWKLLLLAKAVGAVGNDA